MHLSFLSSSGVYVPEAGFVNSNYTTLSGWIHIVINFIGPNHGEGYKLYLNGALFGRAPYRFSGFQVPADGVRRIVIGRAFTNFDGVYGSVDVDELVFFNQTLTPREVMSLYNYTSM